MTAIILMGVSGSGKSTLGRLLASRLSAPFIEGDEYHPPANVAKMRAGVPLEDDDRWPWLVRVAQAMNEAHAADTVVVGTCSALKRAYRDCLRDRIRAVSFFVCLEADEATLEARLAHRAGHFMPATLLKSQLATLERPDAAEAAVCVPAAIPVKALIARLRTIPHLLVPDSPQR